MPKDIEIKDLNESIEEIGKGFEEFKAANDARLTEIEKKGSADVLTEEKLEKINEHIQKVEEKQAEIELASKRQAKFITDANGDEIDLDKKAHDWAASASRERNRTITDFTHDNMTEYKRAIAKYMRSGMDDLNDVERKALSVGGDTAGGFRVNPDTSGRIVTQVYETSPMRAYASDQQIGTDALEGIYDLEEAGSGWVDETESRAETTTPGIDQWRIPTHELSANPKATQKLLDDAEIDMEAWLAGKVAEKFARDEAAAFVIGNGAKRPRGFLTYPDGTTLPGTIERVKTGVNGGFAATPSGGNVIIDMVQTIKAQYLPNSNWFMGRNAVKEVRKMKDSNGEMIWRPGLERGVPSTLAGYPIAAFEDMPLIATGSLSIAFGDMRQAYQIVSRTGIRTLRDPFSSKPFTSFYTTKRVGGDVVNFEALKLIEFSA